MGNEALKIELIEWLTKLEDEETIQYLKTVKEAKTTNQDWWSELPENVKRSI